MKQHFYLPQRSLQKMPRYSWRIIFFTLIVVIGALLALPALLLGAVLQRAAAKSWDHRDRWAGIWGFAILSTAGYITLGWFFHVYTFFWHTLTNDIGQHLFNTTLTSLLEFGGYQILLAPAIALLLEGVYPQTRQNVANHSIALLTPREASNTSVVPAKKDRPRATIIGAPTDIEGEMVVGQALDGTLWQWVRAGWLCYPPDALTHHALLLGRPGSGKSKTAMRLAYGAALAYGMKVFYIDGKGDWDTAAEFKQVMLAAGAARIGVFPGDRHNGWYGSRQDVINRLMNCQHYSDSYYAGHALNLLKYAFYLPGHESPTNSQELLDRLYPSTLKQLYKGSPEYAYLQSLRQDVIWGPHSRYTALFNAVGNGLDGECGFGNWDAAYYLLDQKRMQQQSAIFAKLLLDDFELYIALRNAQPGPHPRVMLIIDDYSAFSDLVSIRDLLERLRSAGVAVIATAQGARSLGPNEQEQERLLESAGATILHSCILPKRLVQVAGTQRTPDLTHFIEDDNNDRGPVLNMAVRASVHMREEASIDPNDVQQLSTGEIFLATNGCYQRAQVEAVPVPDIDIQRTRDQLTTRAMKEEQDYEATQAAKFSRKRPSAPRRQTKAKLTPSVSPNTLEQTSPSSLAKHLNVKTPNTILTASEQVSTQTSQMPASQKSPTLEEKASVKPKKLQDLL